MKTFRMVKPFKARGSFKREALECNVIHLIENHEMKAISLNSLPVRNIDIQLFLILINDSPL